MKNKIVLVDDDVTNLVIGKSILGTQYDLITVPSGEKLFLLLQKTKPDLILLDVEMPEMDGFSVLRRLKSREPTTDIPVIFLTAKNDASSELEGLSLGAIDYIAKPFSAPLLLKRLELHLLLESQKLQLIDYTNNLQQKVLERTHTILALHNSILKNVANMVEYRDEVTGGHVERTRGYLSILLDALNRERLYSEETDGWDRELLLQSSQLHDLGKISIRDSILLKPDKLSNEEFEIMKKHTTYGEQMITEMQKDTPESGFLTYAKIFASTHHEKWDGRGYPHGLSGQDIPLQGRLMAIADVYDALISSRPYKQPFSHTEAVQIILDSRGSQFEPLLVDLFLTVADEFEILVQQQRMAQPGNDTAKITEISAAGAQPSER
ncbi:two-component system response regulator [Spirochaetia bacterium]|nr:two-component system response regulator [Spirochaetia bacterium]